MKGIKTAIGRLVKLVLLLAIAIGVLYKMRVNIPVRTPPALREHRLSGPAAPARL